MSPGRMPLPSIMFSQDAVIMCTCAHMRSGLEIAFAPHISGNMPDSKQGPQQCLPCPQVTHINHKPLAATAHLHPSGLDACQGLRSAQDCPGAAHVKLHHLDHAAHFQIVAPAVKGQALAHKPYDLLHLACMQWKGFRNELCQTFALRSCRPKFRLKKDCCRMSATTHQPISHYILDCSR